ncbi:MAG TPA: LysM domain-containing protein [Puia sp.]|nr:LysM domain-containing protein [Puia sp.]
MKKLVIALGIGLCLSAALHAQSYLLVIQGENGKFYLDHAVTPKENWYSVGRLYNISPRQIAPFNGLTIDKPLTIGQQLKIPLTTVNFTQNTKKAPGETLVPVYHVIKEKEWMYHISTTYNKVPIESLEKWNHINRDQAKAGMDLIVGYLRVKTSESAFATGNTEKTVAQTTLPAPKKEEVKTTGSELTDTKPAAAAAVPVVPVTKPESKPVVTTASTTSAPVSQPTTPSQVNTYAASHQTGGFFISDFSGNGKTVTGIAATFKSSSGWQDGKYYALMNNVPVGTIIKVTSPTTSKSIFAKVLGQLPEMKESAGLAIRISNAAASELGTGEGRFEVEIRY